MIWGTYRPNLYFGTRARNPDSLLTGLAWFGLESMQSKPWENVRHSCEQGDNLAGYAWNKHDGRKWGTQLIKDSLNNIAIKTEFVKVDTDGSSKGGDWILRVTGEKLNEDEGATVSLLFYAGLNDRANGLLPSGTDQNRVDGKGPLGEFSILGREIYGVHPSVQSGKKLPKSFSVNRIKMNVNGNEIWKMKNIIQEKMVEDAKSRIEANGQQNGILPPSMFHLLPVDAHSPNVVIFQHSISAPFTIEYAYISNGPKRLESDPAFAENYFGEALTKIFKNSEYAFDEKFDKIFSLKEKGYEDTHVAFGKMLLGNMLGGIGYFHGTSIEDHARIDFDEEDFIEVEELEEEYDDYFGESEGPAPKREIPPPNPQLAGPYSLFTGVPSRPFFPRGFLWDSGFDHHLIEAFDSELSLDIISSWANLIDEKGWLAREQILGDEARSKVPAEFQVQYPHFANPPTLITALEKQVEMIEMIVDTNMDKKSVRPQIDFLTSVYPKFKRQYDWFHSTQMGQVGDWDYGAKIKLGFKWRGRKGKHILTSGMDDFPRSTIAHSGDLHVDLISWVSYFAKRLEGVASVLGYEKDVVVFRTHQKLMSETLDKVHWNPQTNTYNDVTFSENSKQFVDHIGYVSIAPLLLGLIPFDSPKLGAILNVVRDPNGMWSDYGVCSLSKQDSFFGMDENYWRGPIWINMNYLLLQSLSRHYMREGPYQEKAKKIYKELRNNLVNNVFRVKVELIQDYESQGYVWEQYSCLDGKGSRSHPFTGWTSLILMIMSEKY